MIITFLEYLNEVVTPRRRWQDEAWVKQLNISSTDIASIMKIDPTTRKKYSAWLTKMHFKNKDNVLERRDLEFALEEFETLCQAGLMPSCDINSYSNVQDFINDVLEAFDEQLRRDDKNSNIKSYRPNFDEKLAAQGIEVKYDDGEWQVVKCLNNHARAKLCIDSAVCIKKLEEDWDEDDYTYILRHNKLYLVLAENKGYDEVMTVAPGGSNGSMRQQEVVRKLWNHTGIKIPYDKVHWTSGTWGFDKGLDDEVGIR